MWYRTQQTQSESSQKRETIMTETKTHDIVEYREVHGEIIALVETHKDVPDVTTKEGYKLCSQIATKFVTLRTTIEKKRKEIKAVPLDLCKQIDDAAKELTALAAPTEKMFMDAKKAQDAIEDEIKREKQRIEEERVAAIEEKLERFRQAHTFIIDKTAAEMNEAIEALDETEITYEEYAEYDDEALALKDEARTRMVAMQVKAAVREEEDEKRKEDQARLDKERAEFAAEQAKMEEARQKERDIETDRMAAINAKQKAIAAEQAEAQNKIDCANAEIERQQAAIEEAKEAQRLEEEKQAEEEAAEEVRLAEIEVEKAEETKRLKEEAEAEEQRQAEIKREREKAQARVDQCRREAAQNIDALIKSNATGTTIVTAIEAGTVKHIKAIWA